MGLWRSRIEVGWGFFTTEDTEFLERAQRVAGG